jgi:hypothetical protein
MQGHAGVHSLAEAIRRQAFDPQPHGEQACLLGALREMLDTRVNRAEVN